MNKCVYFYLSLQEQYHLPSVGKKTLFEKNMWLDRDIFNIESKIKWVFSRLGQIVIVTANIKYQRKKKK